MNKKINRFLIAGLCFSLLCIIPASLAAGSPVKVGELTWLQEDSEQRSASLSEMQEAIAGLFGPDEEPEETEPEETDSEAPDMENLYSCEKEIVYFDNLNSMLMALKSGAIDAAGLYTSVCRYISHRNDDFVIFGGDSFNASSPESSNRVMELNMMDAFLSVDFSFMFMEGNEALRDLFNEALQDIREDGTLEKLLQDEVATAFFDPEKAIDPVEIKPIEDAETIRVGVTGDLPPIDYFTEDGQPAGFSTDILSEISRRIGKNIEFVSVDAGARLLALTSGQVDVIFWARNHADHDTYVDTQAWSIMLRDHPDLINDLSAEDEAMIQATRKAIQGIRSSENEQMEGTILSIPFYSDWYAYLIRK